MRRRALTTIEDVARAARVSTATVSRCLNDSDRVAAATRARVIAVVEQLGYTPNFGGQALASNRTRTVGAVIPTIDNAIFARGVQSFQEELSKHGVTLLLASSDYNSDREAEQIRVLVSRGADGLLLIGTARPDSTYEYLQRQSVPFVIAWNLAPEGYHFVGFDNRRAAAEITRKVIEFGHNRIGMIAGITSMNDRAWDRVEGVRDVVRQLGLPSQALEVVEAAYEFDSAGIAFERLWERRPRPTAIICGNDILAVGAISRAKSLGVDIPRDVSVTGFDDIDIAAAVEPALTTVHVPHQRMGRAAAELILRLIKGEYNGSRVEFSATVRMRASLIAPLEQKLTARTAASTSH